MTIEEHKNRLIVELTAARASVLDTIRLVPPGREDEVFLGIWSIKDLLAHLEGWDFTNLQAISEILAGQAPTFFQFFDKDWHSYNARLVQQYKRDSFSELLVDVNASHLRLVGYLQTLTAPEIVTGKFKRPNGRTITVKNLLVAETRDELVHAQQVRETFKI